ncbi:hypothetical protein FisN_18Lh039 [Fistulifera solaris]|uniref:Uncharacterized protein n=1 Tax=Fistulifera solaris TaxID=1519565 RepID=A0A1Z5K1E9_FISSO|nr:hypothetical protein FisN_18Lh039 [Fistulifera solaris]|eukprot:GAX20100.1 hypothetical protein FisN_18Lh039 [Fistulifera solaris]
MRMMIQSLLLLFCSLGFLSHAASYYHRELSATMEILTNDTDSESIKNEKDTVANTNSTETSPSKKPKAATIVANEDDAKSSKKPINSSTAVIPGQQETNYVNTSISQWDITNKSMISMNESVSENSGFLPKERPQSTGWLQSCLGIFLGLAVILFGLTAHQKYRKRRHYENAPEMQTLVV